jgi:hypothetical protein
VLEGIHGAGIDVDVGIKLLKGDAQAPAFQKGANGGGRQAFAKGGEDPAGDKNELCFLSWAYFFHEGHYSNTPRFLQGKLGHESFETDNFILRQKLSVTNGFLTIFFQ